MASSPTKQLLDKLLAEQGVDGGVDQFIGTRRAFGQSWRRIALALRDATSVDVTPETLRNWTLSTSAA